MAIVYVKSISELLNASGVQRITTGDANVSSASQAAEETDYWKSISAQFQQWHESAEYQSEGGHVSPSLVALIVANNVLKEMKEKQFSLPSRVIANGDGGIVIKFAKVESAKTVFEIDANGEIELRRYQKNRIVSQSRIEP